MPAGRSPRREATLLRVGIDLAEVARVEELFGTDPDLRREVFTSTELAYCARRRSPAEHLAARFAAKEAVLKALGAGMGPRLAWTDIEVVNDLRGRPSVRMHGEARALADRLGLNHAEVSLSHTAGLAVAQVVLTHVADRPALPDGEEGDRST